MDDLVDIFGKTPTLTVPLPNRENIEAKGRRYLLEGRLRVLLVYQGRIYAEVRGNGEIWHCGLNAQGKWWCSCPTRQRCSHLVALQLVASRASA